VLQWHRHRQCNDEKSNSANALDKTLVDFR
jgi:hypothetical protein